MTVNIGDESLLSMPPVVVMRVFFVYPLCLIPAPQPILCLSRTGWIGTSRARLEEAVGVDTFVEFLGIG